jgi:hypothetical protein
MTDSETSISVTFYPVRGLIYNLKIPKISKAVSGMRTDNTIETRKGTTAQTMIYKTLHRNLKIEQHEPH